MLLCLERFFWGIRYNHLNFTSDSSSDEEIAVDAAKLAADKAIWTDGGFSEDPWMRQPWGSRLIELEKNSSPLQYFLHFMPHSYIQNVVIPATNRYP